MAGYLASIFFFKVNNNNVEKWKMYEICSKLTTKRPKWRHWHHSGVFIVNFKHFSRLFLLFLFLTLNNSFLVMYSNLLFAPSTKITKIISINYFRKKFYLKMFHRVHKTPEKYFMCIWGRMGERTSSSSEININLWPRIW